MSRILIALLVAGGCGRVGFDATPSTGDGDGDGDGDGGIETLAGFWVMTSAQVTGESGIRHRDDLVNGLRGELSLVAAGAEYTGYARALSLQNGQPQAPAVAVDVTVEVDGDLWIVRQDSTHVFMTAPGADQVELTHVPDDPRDTSAGGLAFDQLILTRASGPSFEPGDYTILSVGQGDVVQPTGECFAAASGFQMLTGVYSLTARFISSGMITTTTYSDAACTVEIPPPSIFMGAGFDEFEGSAYRSWQQVGSGTVALAGAVSRTAGGTTIAVDSCEPATICGTLPDQITIAPAI